MNNRTLLQITEEYVGLIDYLEGLDESENPDLEADEKLKEYITGLKTDREVKLDNYAAVIKEFEARAAMRKQFWQQLKAKADRDEANAKRMKERIKEHFIATGQTKFEGPRFTIKLTPNGGVQPMYLSPRLESTPELLPPEFQKHIIEADKEAIRDALMNGEALEDESGAWAKLEERGQHIRVK